MKRAVLAGRGTAPALRGGAWICVACLLACGSNAPVQDTAQQRPRGIFPSEAMKEQPSAAPTQPAAQAPAPLQQPATTETEAKRAPAAEEEKPKERDLGAELLAALGSPVDCLKPRSGSDVPPSIKVQLDAYVLETGLVTRAYAHSAQLGSDELQCMSKRVSSLQLRGPIDGAPRAVSATLELALKIAENPPN